MATDDYEPTPGFADEIQRVLDSIPTPQPAQPTDEKEAVRQRWLEPAQPSQPNPAPPVGTSPLARQLEEEGWFARREAEHAVESEHERQDAIERSQGWSARNLAAGVRDFFARGPDYTNITEDPTTALIYPPIPRLTPEEARAAAQAELETRQRTAPQRRELADIYRESAGQFSQPQWQGIYPQSEIGPGRRPITGTPLSTPEFAHAIAGRLISADATRQEQALARAQRMMRGEEQLPTYSAWRAAVMTGERTIAQAFTSSALEFAGILAGYGIGAAQGDIEWTHAGKIPVPIPRYQDNRLTKFGEDLEAAIKRAIPDDPARQFEFSQTLAQGFGSTAAFAGQGFIGSLLGAGVKGQLALIALSGAAMQVPDEFQRVTEAMNRGTATERDRAIVTLANIALGATEAVPFAPTLSAAARGYRARLLHGFGQLGEETGQETFQNLGQNTTRMLTYDPDQDPYEGVLEAGLTAAITGFAAGTAFSGGGHGADAGVPPGQQGPGAVRRAAVRAMDTFLDPLARAENERHNAAIAEQEARRNPERDWANAEREARARTGGVRTDVTPAPAPAQPETPEQQAARLRETGSMGFGLVAIGGDR